MYRYPVANGIRVATMKLDKHLHSHMVIAGDRAIVPYEGQPVSCYACGGTGHMRQTYPHRRSEEQASPPAADNSWVQVAATGKPNQKSESGRKWRDKFPGCRGRPDTIAIRE